MYVRVVEVLPRNRDPIRVDAKGWGCLLPRQGAPLLFEDLRSKGGGKFLKNDKFLLLVALLNFEIILPRAPA